MAPVAQLQPAAITTCVDMTSEDSKGDDRQRLKRSVFECWDEDRDGFLKQEEMLLVARCVGFDGPDEEWASEYAKVCKEHDCQPSEGMSFKAIMSLLDDDSPTGCFLANAALERILQLSARRELKKRAFKLWDGDSDGLLKEAEMLRMARSVGFKGSEEEFRPEYFQLCRQRGRKPEEGLGEEAIMSLLDDESSDGCFVSTEELAEITKDRSAGSSAAPAEAEDKEREDLKRRAFALWDGDGDGKLNCGEMMGLARCLGFEGAEQEWREQYGEICAQWGCQAERGLPKERVMKLLEDQSDAGCYMSTSELRQLLSGPSPAPGADAAAGPASTKPAAVPATAAPVVQTSAEPTKAQAEAEEATRMEQDKSQSQLRDSLKHRVFLLWDADSDGALKKEELVKLAQHVGFTGSMEEWSTEYAQMCTQRGCTARYGMPEQVYNDFLDDASEMGCFLTNEDLARILAVADEDATAKNTKVKGSSMVILCDQDGSPKKEEMMKIAKAIGFIGEVDRWYKEFAQVLFESIGAPSGGLSQEAVMVLADRAKKKMPSDMFKKAEAKLGDAPKVSWRQKRHQKNASTCLGEGNTVEPPPKKGKIVVPPSKAEIESAAEKRKPRCEACETEPVALAVIQCLNCEAYLCAPCNDLNHPTALLKKHKRQPLVQDGVDAYSRFRYLFHPGAKWQLTASVALWRNEWGRQKIGGINATSPWGGPNVFQILECGEKRLKVKGIRGGSQNVGWLDVNLLVDKQSGDLMIRPAAEGKRP